MKKTNEGSNYQVFYSRNPSALKDDINNCKNKSLVDQVVIDYEFKKAVDYGALSQSMQLMSAFSNIKSLYLNFGQCALNTQKLLLLLRGCSTYSIRLKSIYMIFENCTTIGQEGVEAINKFLLECGPNLQVLVISFRKCNLGTETCISLLDCIKQLELKALSVNLDSNKIIYNPQFGNALKAIFSKSSQAKLVEVCLSHNELGDIGVRDLAKAVTQLKNVSCMLISLVGNQLGDEGISVLSESIKNLKNIQNLYLCLDWNKITQEGAKELANGIKNLTNLISLNIDLDYNEIGAQGAADIAGCMMNSPGLQNLLINLAHNEFGDQGAIQIGKALPVLKQLKNMQIELGWNKIGGEGMKSIANKIEKQKALQSLNIYVDNNQIGDHGLNQISICLLQLTQLIKLQLDLDDNNIGPESVKAMITSLTGMPLKNLLVNLIKNEIDQATIDQFSKILKNNFPKIQTDNFTLKSGNQKALPFLTSKITQSTGVSAQIIRFCELSREKVPHNSSSLLISHKDFYGILEELIKTEIIAVLNDINSVSDNSIDFLNKLENSLDNIQGNQSGDFAQDLALFEGDKRQENNYNQKQENNNYQDQNNNQSPQKNKGQQQQQQQQQRSTTPEKRVQFQNQQDNNYQMTGSSNEAIFYELKQENITLKKEIYDLKRRVAQKHEPDVFVNIGKLNNLECQFFPSTLREFVQERKLGNGSFGEVWLVSRGSQQFAMKGLEIDLNVKRNYLKDLKEYFIQINDVIRSIKHNNILYIYGMALDITENGAMRTTVIMEYMKYNLMQYIKDQKNTDQNRNLAIMREVLEGLIYFQKNNIVHCGIKPSNILLDDSVQNNNQYAVKISDIGIAKIVKIQLNQDGESSAVHGFAPKFSAPEIFDGRENETTDIWSFGCILLYLFTGESPWAGLSEYQQLTVMLKKTSILQHFKNSKMGQNIKLHPKIEKLIDICTKYEGRLTAEELMKQFPTTMDDSKTISAPQNQKPETKKEPTQQQQQQQSNSKSQQSQSQEKSQEKQQQSNGKSQQSQSQEKSQEKQQEKSQEKSQQLEQQQSSVDFDPNEPTKTLKK